MAANQTYHELELNLVSNLKTLQEIASSFRMKETFEEISSILNDVKSHSFRIAVVGEFRRGKSTFINALLGKKILPSDVLPTTATISRVTYGLTPKVEIKYKADNGKQPQIEEVAIEELENYVTKLTEESASKADRIEEAVVYYPTAFCRKNVDIIDTPGLSDDERMTNITKSVLPKVHAALMIIQASYPFSQSEAEFLDYLIKEGINKVIYVVSGIDKLEEEEIPRALETIAKRINQNLIEISKNKFPGDASAQNEFIEKFGATKVLGVSGLLALKAKQKGDESLRQESKFDEMETFLEKFLTEESGKVLLQAWVKQIEKVSGKILAELKRLILEADSQIKDIEKKYQVNVALAETLRRILSQELDDLHTIYKETENTVGSFDSEIAKSMASLIDTMIDDYNITANDFSFFQNDEFHRTLARKIAEIGNETINPKGEQLYNRISENFEILQSRVVKTIISVEYVSAHIYELAGFADADKKANPNLADGIFNCSNITPEQIYERLWLPPEWSFRFFLKVRLPTGEFNIISRRSPIATFRSEIKRISESEVRDLLQEQGIKNKIFTLIQQTFGQIKSELENIKRHTEGMQFEFRSNDERRKTFLEQKIANLKTIGSKIDAIKQETQTIII